MLMHAGSPEVITGKRLSAGPRLPRIPGKPMFAGHREH
jgi:hypothetical protein